MEAAEAIEIFNRSITKHNLIYPDYLGDGDKNVVDSKPYVDYILYLKN